MLSDESGDRKCRRPSDLFDDIVGAREDTLPVIFWGERVRALTGGRGVDRVVEVGGPATIRQSLLAVRYGAEIASIGFLSTENPGIDFFKLKLSGAIFRNIAVGDRDGLQDVARTVAMAGLKPVIDRVFEFENAREAFIYLDTGSHFGKVVIRCSDPD